MVIQTFTQNFKYLELFVFELHNKKSKLISLKIRYA